MVKTLETSDVVLSLEIVNSNLFITADGKTVKLWDANSFKVIKSFTLPHKVESASYSPEKRKFAAGGEDMWVHLYDFDSGDEIDCNRGGIQHGSGHSPCCLLHLLFLHAGVCSAAQCSASGVCLSNGDEVYLLLQVTMDQYIV